MHPAFTVYFRRSGLILGLSALSLSAQEVTVRLPVAQDARSSAQTAWRFTTTDPGTAEWSTASFPDGDWSAGMGGFGTGVVQNSHINSEWMPGQIWMRKEFTLPEAALESAILSLHHDEDVEIFLNGQAVYQETGWLNDYGVFYISDEYKSVLHPGVNVLAATCRNTDGPGYIDVGLAVDIRLAATTLISDARTFPTEWSYVTADPGTGWHQPEFEASGWLTGQAGFGTGDIYAGGTSTPWQETDIWMRATFKVDSPFDLYRFTLQHDDDAEVYINGNLVLSESGWTGAYSEQVLEAVAQAVKAGDNTIAVHCHNNDGPGFVDVGLQGLAKPATSALRGRRAGARTGASIRGAFGVDGRSLRGGRATGYIPLGVHPGHP